MGLEIIMILFSSRGSTETTLVVYDLDHVVEWALTGGARSLNHVDAQLSFRRYYHRFRNFRLLLRERSFERWEEGGDY